MAPLPRLLVLYASQTGNSKDVAERVAREAKRRHFRPAVLAMDAYQIEHLPEERLVVFVAATTGQGEPPGNMTSFWRFLRRVSLPPDLLAGMKVAVFGLGDSGYVQFNVVAKKLDRRLATLGAQELLPRGLGDDQNPSGYEAALDPWLNTLWKRLRAAHPLPAGLTDPGDDEIAGLDSPRYRVTLLPGAASTREADEQAEAVSAAFQFGRLEDIASGSVTAVEGGCTQPEWGAGRGLGEPCMATLLENARVTAAEHFQDTRHLRFDLGASGLQYDPGDVLSIFPRQDESAVTQLLAMLNLRPEQRIRVALAEPEDGNCRAEMEACLGAFIQGVLDVNGASPRRHFFEVLHHFAVDELQRERLAHFATPEGREDLSLYNQSEGRTVLEVLRDFGSARPPLEWLLQCCPRLRPRQFSIASSAAAHPRQAHVLLAVVDFRTPFKRRKRGLCSSWLAGLPPGAHVPVWAEKGVLHLPPDPSIPLIMIGPGTGVAPFKAFLEEREVQAAKGVKQAPGCLYFGCRSQKKDFYYADLWQRLLAKGVLAARGGLVTAFSRDQGPKVYVTHRLADNAAHLFELLQQGAWVYVSGSAEKMPQEVAAVFQQKVLQAQGGLPLEAARKYMRQLEASGRYVVEAWS